MAEVPSIFHDKDGNIVIGPTFRPEQSMIDNIMYADPTTFLESIQPLDPIKEPGFKGTLLWKVGERLSHRYRWLMPDVIPALTQLEEIGIQQHILTGRNRERLEGITMVAHENLGLEEFIPVDQVIMKPQGMFRSTSAFKAHYLTHTLKGSGLRILIDNDLGNVLYTAKAAMEMGQNDVHAIWNASPNKSRALVLPSGANVHHIHGYGKLPALVRDIIS